MVVIHFGVIFAEHNGAKIIIGTASKKHSRTIFLALSYSLLFILTPLIYTFARTPA